MQRAVGMRPFWMFLQVWDARQAGKCCIQPLNAAGNAVGWYRRCSNKREQPQNGRAEKRNACLKNSVVPARQVSGLRSAHPPYILIINNAISAGHDRAEAWVGHDRVEFLRKQDL